jgi:hypothetical protein
VTAKFHGAIRWILPLWQETPAQRIMGWPKRLCTAEGRFSHSSTFSTPSNPASLLFSQIAMNLSDLFVANFALEMQRLSSISVSFIGFFDWVIDKFNCTGYTFYSEVSSILVSVLLQSRKASVNAQIDK